MTPHQRALAHPLTVEPLGPGRYGVSGGRTPHVVTINADTASCDCGDHQYRKRTCKHLVVVGEHLRFSPITVTRAAITVTRAAGPGLERDVPPPDEPTDGS